MERGDKDGKEREGWKGERRMERGEKDGKGRENGREKDGKGEKDGRERRMEGRQTGMELVIVSRSQKEWAEMMVLESWPVSGDRQSYQGKHSTAFLGD